MGLVLACLIHGDSFILDIFLGHIDSPCIPVEGEMAHDLAAENMAVARAILVGRSIVAVADASTADASTLSASFLPNLQ